MALIIRNNIVRSVPSPPDTIELSHQLQDFTLRVQALEERLAHLEMRTRRLEDMQKQYDAMAILIVSLLTPRPMKHKSGVRYAQI